MRVFSRAFCGCKEGDIYPTVFQCGDKCPAELLDAAVACDALEPDSETKPKAKPKAKPKRG